MKSFALFLVLSSSFIGALSAQTEATPFEACIAGKCQDGDITRAELFRSTGLQLTDAAGHGIVPSSFDMLFHHGVSMEQCHTEGANYSESCKKLMRGLEAGDYFEVFNITIFEQNALVELDLRRRYTIVTGR